jgi:hypothetical protein
MTSLEEVSNCIYCCYLASIGTLVYLILILFKAFVVPSSNKEKVFEGYVP